VLGERITTIISAISGSVSSKDACNIYAVSQYQAISIGGVDDIHPCGSLREHRCSFRRLQP
jgi:hypothetical protein